MKITDSICYVGVNDHQVDLFEGQYKVPFGMAYNSYVLMDERIAVMDTVDVRFCGEWLAQITGVLCGRKPDYLIIQHMEPDHSGSISGFLKAFPEVTVVSNAQAFCMMDQFFGEGVIRKKLVVENGSSLSLGRHQLSFVFAPMVHWPEVMVTYDSMEKVLFSADGFGKFGANDVEDPAGWVPEARRYYIGIVGKYGAPVQALLKAAAGLEIHTICATHGPILTDDADNYLRLAQENQDAPRTMLLAESLAPYLDYYDKWSSYMPEEEGVTIAFTSVYGHTKEAALTLGAMLDLRGVRNVALFDLARDDMAEALASAFRYDRLVLATTTYNGAMYPYMRTFIGTLVEHSFQKRKVGLIENGTWAPAAKSAMEGMLKECSDLRFAGEGVTIRSALNAESIAALERLADLLCGINPAPGRLPEGNKQDGAALFKIGYGLYVVTSNDGTKDNGMICNTVSQLTNDPLRVAVNINKLNYSHDTIRRTGKMNVNCLSVDAPFSIFTRFGFQSGKDKEKFEGFAYLRSDNDLAVLPEYANAFMSLVVEDYVDLGTHGMFICRVSESRVLNSLDTMTYAYYQANVKPKPQAKEKPKKGYVCKVCGYIYEGDELPADFVCPICKHGASDFEPLK